MNLEIKNLTTLYYYQLTAFILKGGEIGVTHGTFLCVCIASPVPIKIVDDAEKITAIILEGMKKIEEHQTTSKVRIDGSKQIRPEIFDKRKIKIIITF